MATNNGTMYCSQVAQQADEPLYGSAAQAQVWFLLEYDKPWQAKALQDNDLPEAVQAWLRQQEDAVAASRSLFIKRDQASVEKSFYIAITDPADPRLYRFTFAEYARLLHLDAAAIIAGETEAIPVDETLVLVCTNGKRDQCCAKFGLPVYRKFAAQPDLSAWQCTHLGGHRYSATAATFPSGIYYGYLSPSQVPIITAAIQAGTIHLPNYRGRTHYPGAVSAADYFVRRTIEQSGLSALSLISTTQDNGTWRIQFADQQNVQHTVEISETRSEPVLASCNKSFKPQPHFQLLNHAVVPADRKIKI